MRRTVVAALLLTALLPVIAQAQAPARADDNKAIARRYFEEILNKGSVAAIDAIIAPDVVFRNPPAVIKGIADFKALVATLRGAFPDLQFTLEDELADGNKAVTRWVMRGTQGTCKVDVTGMDMFLIDKGKIREIWVSMDSLKHAQQMGTVPVP
ncbi:MAG TPA: nuclear transport factor 2 family protein [Vicinamibacterales bacterium]|nr:nuclear transport factor 2 family protein [Vicinamibacterales bacterium]